DRAEVDDVTAVADVWKAEARHAHEPVHVRLEDRALVLLTRLVERRAPEREAGVVDQDVDAAELADRGGNETLAAGRIGDVELEGQGGREALARQRSPRDPSAGRR